MISRLLRVGGRPVAGESWSIRRGILQLWGLFSALAAGPVAAALVAQAPINPLRLLLGVMAAAATLLAVAVAVLLARNRRLRRSLSQDAALLEHIGDGLMVTDAAQGILRVNHTFCDITGYPPEEILGRTPRSLHSGRHDRAFYRDMWAAIDRDGVWKGEIWNRRRDGQLYAEWLAIAAVKDAAGRVTNYVATFSDITRMKVANEQLHYLAHHHPLTGLPNRLLLMARLQHALDQARRYRSGVAVMFIDLDGFKQVNDSFGHATGDRVLMTVGRRLSERLRRGDTAAHIGGDEFVIVAERIYRPSAAAVVARKLAAALAEPIEEEGEAVALNASIGISLFPEDGESPEQLIRRADEAMYRAKAAGGAAVAFYAEDRYGDGSEIG